MSQLLVQKYLNDLADLRQASGSGRESVVREAFKTLLKDWGKSEGLIFIPEYEHMTAMDERRYVDGALVEPQMRLPHGYWEAKDSNDDLDAEIAKKFRRGYPQDNIVFEDSKTAVLIQNKKEVFRCPVDDPERIEKLIERFFKFEPEVIREFRKAVEQFREDLPAVLETLRKAIDKAEAENANFRKAAVKFLKHAQETINPSVTAADVREMLIQHILTEEIFSQVFDNSDFHHNNNVAKELYALEGTFFTGGVKRESIERLKPYYAAIKRAAAVVFSHQEKQKFLKVIYENFYKVYNRKAADRLGVAYTPNEIVRFMIESADWLCQKHFGKKLIDRNVEILDPATGTGTFIVDLLEHFRGQKDKLRYKYLEELHANEVAILPYYVANLNIEATYAAITGEYLEYPNLCFVDTLDNVAGLRAHGIGKGQHFGDLLGSLSEENVARIKRQNQRKISVIIGNPPYNANQLNENENNKNREYDAIDKRIRETYIAASVAQKTKLYDMYARFFRWASDRIEQNGVIAFISNRSFIDGRTFDGFRKLLTQEFDEIYVIDLGGDVRADPRLSGPRNNVFAIQTGVAISLLVRKSNREGCRIRYVRRPQLETADEKLSFLNTAKLEAIPFSDIEPAQDGSWINQGRNDFFDLIPLVSLETKSATKAEHAQSIAKLFSNGVVTARDEWAYDFSKSRLEDKIREFCSVYRAEMLRWRASSEGHIADTSKRADALRNFVDRTIKWTEELERHLDRGTRLDFEANLVRLGAYRPYVAMQTFYANAFTHRVYRQDEIFPIEKKWDNLAIGFSGLASAKPFQSLMVDRLPSFDLLEKTQFVPRYRIIGKERLDNITDWALEQFRGHYKIPPPERGRSSRASGSGGGQSATAGADPSPDRPSRSSGRSDPPFSREGKEITKDAIFHYVYGVLHDPVYREKYALNLKREFPRIPFYADFWKWAEWGEKLMALHIGYETAEPWPLKRVDTVDKTAKKSGVAPKAILKALKDTGVLVLDSDTQLTGVPKEAWDYRLGNRSALEWILDQYKEKTPKDPTIREKFNTYRFADYKDHVIDLLKRVTRVSVETQEIVEAMKTAKSAR